MKIYSIMLPVFKQGDDLASHLVKNNSAEYGFTELFLQYKEAAKLSKRIANFCSKHPEITVNAGTHHIGFDGPENILNKMVRRGLAEVEEIEDDENEFEE